MAELPALAAQKNLIGLLQRCRQSKNLEHAKRLHAYMQTFQLESHDVLGNYLVPLLADCGSMADAQTVFEKLSCPNEHSWCALISGYIQCGDLRFALRLYHQTQEKQLLLPNIFIYMVLLKACVKLADADTGAHIHARIVGQGFDSDPFIGHNLVDLYSRCGLFADAHQVLEKLPTFDVILWTALVAGYSEHGFHEEVLTCFSQMQLVGISPNITILACGLKACGSIGAMERGQLLFADVVRRGEEAELVIGSSAIDMYVKLGLLAEAQKILDILPVRNVVSWTALAAGYAGHGFGDEALKIFKKIQLDGLSPDAVTFLCSLKACGILAALETGRELHAELIRLGFEGDIYIGNALVDMYAKCGALIEAQEVFDSIPIKVAVSWNSLITGYMDSGLGEEALNCSRQMQLDGISPDGTTFICILRASEMLRTSEIGQMAHTEIIKRGLEQEPYVGHSLMDMHAKCGLLLEAQYVFEKFTSQCPVSWSALIDGYAEQGYNEEALNCFEQMKLDGICVDTVTLICSLKACGNMRAIERGCEIHSLLIKMGVDREPFVHTTLVNVYATWDLLIEAQDVFDRLPVREVASWNALIAGYAEHGLNEEALKCFEQMQLKGDFPVLVTYICTLKACGSIRAIETGQRINAEIIKRGLERELDMAIIMQDMYVKCSMLAEAEKLFDLLPAKTADAWTTRITGYAESGLCDKALSCFEQMELMGILSDENTFVCGLKICGMLGLLEKGRRLHIRIVNRGLEREVRVGDTLVDMYSKSGSVVEARKVFEKLAARSAVSWNALIAGYAELGFGEEALECFKQMQLEGICAVAVTFSCSLKACGLVGAVDVGRELHAESIRKAVEGDLFIGSALVNMYADCGSLEEAQEVFDKLPARDVVSWNAMIKGYGENHKGYMAVECFENMLKQKVKPDAITFTCLLVACSRGSLVLEGQKYFEMMRKDYEIHQTLDHVTCMVDLLARSGDVNEADRFAIAMQCPPSKEISRALLTACKIYGKVELGLKYFHQLVQLSQEDANAYMLMAEVYMNAGRTDDAIKIEEKRRGVEAKKLAASTSIELNKKLHEFVIGNNQSKDILTVLETLTPSMKDIGYVPNLEFVVMHHAGDSTRVPG